MALRKQDLENMFTNFSMGLPQEVKSQILKCTGRGGQSASRDYISANCLLAEVRKVRPDMDFTKVQHYKELWSVLHPATVFRLRQYTPCLAARFDQLTDAEKKNMLENPDYVWTSKENGVRVWLIVYRGTVKIYSRNYSDVDCGLCEYSENIRQALNPDFDGIYAVDCEIKFEPGADIRGDLEHLGLTTDSTLEAMVAMLHTYPEDAREIQRKFKEMYGKELICFRLIAPLYFQGKNYLSRTLGEGMDVYDECVEFGQSLGFNIKPIARCAGTREEKEIFLNTILANGGEGIVAHNRKGAYCTSENRSKTSYIKLKRSVSATSGLDDTIDGWISGFKLGSNGTANEGLISAFDISCYINDNGRIYEHVIATVPNIDKETKKLATWNCADGLFPQEVVLSDGSVSVVSLNPDFGHLVCEVDGQSLSSVSVKLSHPRLIRYRMEKSPQECIYTKEWLDSQTENVGIRY